MNDIVIDPALLAEAEALGTDISGAAAQGVAQAIRAARRSQWLDANAAALAASDDDIDKAGLPLARHRRDKITAMQSLVDEGLASGIGNRSPDGLFSEAEARTASAPG